jgi:hypothetical protein
MLAQNENLTEQTGALREIFAAQSEWLFADAEGQTFALQRDEIEIFEQNDKLFLGCLTAAGWRNWRVYKVENTAEKLVFEIAGKFNGAKTRIELTRRISVESLLTEVRAARLRRAQEIAVIARREFSASAKIVRVGLSQGARRGQTGKFARILIDQTSGKTIAVSAHVAESSSAEEFLSGSLQWLKNLEERRKIDCLWLLIENEQGESLQRLRALLRNGWQRKLRFWILKTKSGTSVAETSNNLQNCGLEEFAPLALADLWSAKPKKLSRAKSVEMSEAASKILTLAPDAIDLVRARGGETLRFRGLPFARVRKILGKETVWFGVGEKQKRILNVTNESEFLRLLEQLAENRCAESFDKRNFLYKSAPEAWLEYVLRRDVSRLDPNLILAPLHAQFRLQNKAGALDLLALRTDGRLVVIELKTAPDREAVLQAAGYWLQVEILRRAGALQRSHLFGDLKIADAPALVYLAAPTLSFHSEIEFFARALAPEIEIWRFCLNEDWRRKVRVSRRERIN